MGSVKGGKAFLGLIKFQHCELSETIIGIASQKPRTITLNTLYKNSKRSKYYIAMLEDSLMDGYDCVIKYDGSEVIRKLMVSI